MYLTKSDAEDEWEKYENNYANDVSLSVDFGFQKISGNYLNTKIFYKQFNLVLLPNYIFNLSLYYNPSPWQVE